MAQVHETAVAVGAYGRGRSASSLCILVRGKSWSFAGVQFVLVHQRVMHFSSFGRVRPVPRNLLRRCCDGRKKTRQEMACGSGRTCEAIPLTQRSIDALRPAEMAYRVPDLRCIGLAVRVAPSGIKTWDLAYRIKNSGKTRRLSLGRISDVSLEKARERANELTSAARTGRDLVSEEEEKRAAQASRLTIEQLVELYVRRRAPVVCGRPRKLRAD